MNNTYSWLLWVGRNTVLVEWDGEHAGQDGLFVHCTIYFQQSSQPEQHTRFALVGNKKVLGGERARVLSKHLTEDRDVARAAVLTLGQNFLQQRRKHLWMMRHNLWSTIMKLRHYFLFLLFYLFVFFLTLALCIPQQQLEKHIHCPLLQFGLSLLRDTDAALGPVVRKRLTGQTLTSWRDTR